MKKIILHLSLIFLCTGMNAQEEEVAGQNLFLGASFTYIPNFEVDPFGFGEEYVFHESTLNINLGVQIHKNIRLGLTGMHIRTNSKYSEKEQQYILGGSVKYLFNDLQDKTRFYLETGFYKGNYCTCLSDNRGDPIQEPYKREGLSYWGFGGGVERKLSKHFQLDLGFYNFLILQNIPPKYNFTQYVIGIDYFF